MAKYWLFRLAAWLVPLVPFGVAQTLGRWAGSAIWATAPVFAPETRRRVERNLRHIPDLAEHPERLQWATHGVFQTMCMNYVDFLRGRFLRDEQIFAGWTTTGEEQIDEAMAAGKGLVLLSAHLGGFELGASRLGAKGYRVLAPAERMRPEPVFELFCKLREHHNMHLLPADSRETLRDLMTAIKENEIVIVVADRHVTGSTVTVPFFGEPAQLPTSPIALAQRTGAPAMSVFSWRTGPRSYHGIILPIDTGTEGEGKRARTAEGTTRAMRQWVAQLEEVVAAHPEQWVSALAPIWDADHQQPAERALADTVSAGNVQ